MRKVILILQQLLLLCTSIILIAAVPSFLAGDDDIEFSLLRYGESVAGALRNLASPDSLTLYIHSQNMIIEPMPVNLSYEFVNEIYEIPLFPEVWDIVIYTLVMLLISFAATFIIAVMLGWCAELLPSSFKKRHYALASFLKHYLIYFLYFAFN
ncbi:hypothetical protein ABE41_002570 [Fictibacillus arsenicus]|uniref:Uncharacterized protein n=1 Tax=Fictibacillus arsenicus TaxID=255247 RepID=A0A1B1Z0H5_9BACL|nr:hypothetical protein [Fictibacillus arsenicus]ANX10900.1 hypothetical protein ABE41_002570 [Fictibacillus arsenicus]